MPKLADLYAHAYAGGTSNPDTEKAAARISAVFEGTHGIPIPQASLLTSDGDGRVTAAIVTTERALGSDGSKTAFIAELLTHPAHRRQGLAENQYVLLVDFCQGAAAVLGDFNLDRVGDPVFEAFVATVVWPPAPVNGVPLAVFGDDAGRHFYLQGDGGRIRTTTATGNRLGVFQSHRTAVHCSA
jgi:GNAT superfamily N-acetyltransferase